MFRDYVFMIKLYRYDSHPQLNYNFTLCLKVTSSKEISLLNLNIVLMVSPVLKLQSAIRMYQNSYGTEFLWSRFWNGPGHVSGMR